MAYNMVPKDGRGTHQRSTIVVTGGFDGTMEEAYLAFGATALSRSFNFVHFERPGQGQVIREQGIASRPDWNKVVTPLVDKLLKREQEVHPDRTIPIGWSMGGWLAAQAIAYEHRFCAAVLNDGVYDFASP